LSVIGIKSAPESDNFQSPETCRRRNQVTEILPVQESGGRNSVGTGIRHRQTKFQPGYRRIPAKTVVSGRTRVLIRPDLVKTAGIRPLIWPDPEDSGLNLAILAGSDQLSRQNPATATERCRIPAIITKLLFLHFVIFSCEPNTEKYFQENHFTSTQTEHKSKTFSLIYFKLFSYCLLENKILNKIMFIFI
jgi:hypothetical protein